jgi:dATP/dGTP diphosphohydrolase
MTEVRTTSSTGGQKGVKPERLDLIPVAPMLEVARLYGQGALKYDDHNWRKGYEWSKSIASLERHTLAFKAGQDYDEHEPDCADDCVTHTQRHHMASVVFHALALIEFGETHPDFDDRFKGFAPQ